MTFDLIHVRENLFTRSEEFDHANWDLQGLGAGSVPVITANAGVAPDGTLTADRIQFDCGGNLTGDRSIIRQFPSVSFPIDHNVSFYVKSFDGSPQEISIYINTTTESILTIDGSWTRINKTRLTTTGTSPSGLELRGTFTTGTTSDLLVWGAQVTQSLILLPYSKTIASVLAGPFGGINITPMFDYQEKIKKNQSRFRTRDASQFNYQWGDYKNWKMGVSFVDSGFTSIVNSYWSSNAALEFQDDFEVSSVHVINKIKPIDQFVKPQSSLYKGKIELGTY